MKQINYGVVQLVLLALVVLYGISLLLGMVVPVANKEAFAGVWAILILLLNPGKLSGRISAADDPVPSAQQEMKSPN